MEEYDRLQKKLDEESTVITVEHMDLISSSKTFGFDSKDPKSTIIFTFYLKNVVSRWTLKPEFGPEPRRERITNKPLQQESILINLKQFRSGDEGRENPRQVIDQKLKGWIMIPHKLRQQWIDMALEKARGAVTFMPATHDIVYVNFNVTTASNILSDETKQAALKKMFEELHPCSICLIRLSGPFESLTAPCGHYFHRDCLKKWVGIKPRCPMCRANIPKQARDEV